LPINFWGSGVTAGELSPAVFASVWLIGILVGLLVAFRVLMVWVYECTGSLLVAILMHVSLTAFQYILTPPLGGTPYWIIGFATAAALWVIVAAVSLAQGGHLSRQPPLRRRWLDSPLAVLGYLLGGEPWAPPAQTAARTTPRAPIAVGSSPSSRAYRATSSSALVILSNSAFSIVERPRSRPRLERGAQSFLCSGDCVR
jgi:hypothetical protein